MSNQNDDLVKLISSLLILMFLVSGISKVFSFGKLESSRLTKKLNNFNIKNVNSELFVFLAGIWELLSCMIILYGLFIEKDLNKRQLYINIGAISLVIFTVIVTLVFYTYPFKHLPFLSNLTTICGLLLLLFVCKS